MQLNTELGWNCLCSDKSRGTFSIRAFPQPELHQHNINCVRNSVFTHQLISKHFLSADKLLSTTFISITNFLQMFQTKSLPVTADIRKQRRACFFSVFPFQMFLSVISSVLPIADTLDSPGLCNDVRYMLWSPVLLIVSEKSCLIILAWQMGLNTTIPMNLDYSCYWKEACQSHKSEL